MIYGKWLEPVQSSYASLQKLYEGTVGPARISPFLYPSGGATPNHKGRSPKKRKDSRKQTQAQTPPEPLRSVDELHWEIPPVRFPIVPTPSHARPSHTPGRAREIQSRVRKDADGDDVLLKQPDDENELERSAERIRKGSGESRTYHVVVVGMPLVRRALRRLLLAVPPPAEDTTSRLVIRVDGLHQRVDGREQAGQ